VQSGGAVANCDRVRNASRFRERALELRPFWPGGEPWRAEDFDDRPDVVFRNRLPAVREQRIAAEA
jgi:hypothetical protein